MKRERGRGALPRRGGAIAVVLTLGILVSAAAVAQTPRAPVPTKQETGKPITKEQAKELFRSVDEILAFVSGDTKLSIQHSVKRRLISRDEVNRFLKKKFDEDEGAKRMERSELVLKKFGLLDRDFQLRPFLISLLTEQIAGFYDNKTKTVNLLDWIEPEEQKPVLAHELTHALQDQSVDLERWSSSGVHGLSQNSREDNRHLETDEMETARGAIAEGQAMAVFVDYTLRRSGRTIAEAPELADRLKDSDMSSGGSPVLARAPLLVQQSLLFPYTDGLRFEQEVLVKAGKQAAFAEVLAHPPNSSYEIMNPAAYLAHTPVPTVHLPDIHRLLDAEYTPYDVGVMGALDVRILAELFGGREMSEALTSAWDGGLYYAAQRRAAKEAERMSTSSLAIFYVSRWKNPDSARSFGRMYAGQLARKYSNVKRVEAGADDDEEIYTTNEGDILIRRAGAEVFVSEGFALPLARRLRESLLEAKAAGPMLTANAGVVERSPGMGELCRFVSGSDLSLRDMLRVEMMRDAARDRQFKEQKIW